MADERIYTIPLRREWKKSPRNFRAPRAIRAIKGFVSKHAKTDDVLISKSVNEIVWERGVHFPPARIKVKAVIEDGKARVMLPEEKTEEKKTEETKKQESKESPDKTGQKTSEAAKESPKKPEHQEAAELGKQPEKPESEAEKKPTGSVPAKESGKTKTTRPAQAKKSSHGKKTEK